MTLNDYLVAHIAETRAAITKHEAAGRTDRARKVRAYLVTQEARLAAIA